MTKMVIKHIFGLHNCPVLFGLQGDGLHKTHHVLYMLHLVLFVVLPVVSLKVLLYYGFGFI